MDGASTSGNGALARLRLIIDQLLPHHDIFLLSLLLLLLLSGFLWNISRLRSFLELEFSNLEVTHAQLAIYRTIINHPSYATKNICNMLKQDKEQVKPDETYLWLSFSQVSLLFAFSAIQFYQLSMQNSQDLALELTFPDEAFEIIPPPAKQCRICLSEEQNYAVTDFLQPCICSGSMKYVHFKCLSNWIQRSQPALLRKIGEENYYSCEMCKYKIHFDCSDHYQCNTSQELKKKILVRKVLFAVLIILTVICLGLAIAVSVVLAGQIGAPQSSFSTIILAITLIILTCLLVVLFYIWISDYFLSRSLFISKIHNYTFNNRRKKRSMSPQRTEDTLMTKTNKSACSRITIHPEIILNTSII